jgi:uncharacterized protein YjbJ (UPF0337 family)
MGFQTKRVSTKGFCPPLGFSSPKMRNEDPRVDVVCSLDHSSMEDSFMNWDRVQGNWKQFTGKVKEQWGQLTDDDLTQINGNREQLEGKIQARYGYAKDQVKKDVDDWLNRS